MRLFLIIGMFIDQIKKMKKYFNIIPFCPSCSSLRLFFAFLAILWVIPANCNHIGHDDAFKIAMKYLDSRYPAVDNRLNHVF